MPRRTALACICFATLLPAALPQGGWFAFGEPQSGTPALVWLNPDSPVTAPATLRLDPGLALPEVRTAAVVKGSPRFRIDAPGEFIVELFVQLVARADADLVLRTGGRILDARLQAAPLRLYPGSKRQRTWILSGAVRGGEEFELGSSYPYFLLVAARWTQRGSFETDIAPKLAARLEQMAADPFFEGRRSSRAPRLRELGDLLLHSRQPELRRAGLIGAVRGAYWQAAEDHEPRDIRLTGQLLDTALQEMPDHPLIRQIASGACLRQNTGSPQGMPCTDTMKRAQLVPWTPTDRTDLTRAPQWATAQWRLRARVEDITRYWVTERQRPNGELAGGWGDDVEILRQWGPMALGLGSAVAEEGIRRVALGVWSSGMLKDGYNVRIEDVEHAAEPTSDTLGLLAALDPFGPDTRARLGTTAACSANWIVPQPDGAWRFRSSWFNCAQHDPSPERAVDVHLNTRALGPALWQAWLTRDEALIALLERWGQSWRAAMHSTLHGKRRGLIPAAVRSADGAFLLGPAWDKPALEWDYFQWSRGSQESIARLFQALEDLTGKPEWGDAAREALAAVDLNPPVLEPQREEDLLATLTAEMKVAERRLQINFDMHTREAIYTDRVYYPLPPRLQLRLFGGEAPRGDRAPAFAVTWPAVNTRYSRLVMTADSERLEALLYSFEEQTAEARLRLWRLKPGRYQWRAGSSSGRFEVSRLPADVTMTVEPHRELRLIIEPEPR